MKPTLVLVLALTASTVLGAFVPANRPIDVRHYTIDWQIDPAADPKQFEATTTVDLTLKGDASLVTLDAEELQIKSVTLGRKALTFDHGPDKPLSISLGKNFKKGSKLSFVIQYRGTIQTAHDGLFKVTDPDEPARGPMYFTQFESTGARKFFPGNDEPHDKTTATLITRVPAEIEVVSNGVRSKDRYVKRDGKRWKEVRYEMKQPNPTYLVAVAVAPLARIARNHRGKSVAVWAPKAKLESARFALDSTAHLMKFFDDYLGTPYMWPKYDTVAVPTFLWGGMENTSVTFMNQERTLLNDPESEFEKKGIVGLASHELAHQWFGNYVTPVWWDDIWLNESFASYLGTLGEKSLFGSIEPEMSTVMATWNDYFREEDGPRSHPIVNKALANADEAFDSISYTKGENVLRMLHHLVGDKAFRKGLKSYLHRYRFANATYLDFFSEMEKASKLSLAAFRDSWLLNRGYPILTHSGQWDAKTENYTLRVAQRPNHTEDSTVFHFKLPVAFHRRSTPSYSQTLDLTVMGATAEATLKLPAEPEWVTVNPGAVVLAKVRELQRDEVKLAAQALGDTDAIARVGAAYSLMDGLLEGTEISPLAERTLVSVLSNDPSPYVRNAVLEGVVRIRTRWLPKGLGAAVLSLAQEANRRNYSQAAHFAADPHGWRQWRSRLLAATGKVKDPGALPFLAAALGKLDIGLDDLSSAARGIALLGAEESAQVLRTAHGLHGARGYRFRYWLEYAFGYYEHPAAAAEIQRIAQTTGGVDYLGRIGWAVQDNATLRGSKEWASFLKEFILNDTKFGDGVKSRLLGSIEEEKNDHVKDLLEGIVEKSGSERLKEVARKILEKNFEKTRHLGAKRSHPFSPFG